MIQFALADRLRKARETAGLTQAELAGKIGISRRSVVSYETAVTTPGPLVLRVWAEECDTALDWLKTGEETP